MSMLPEYIKNNLEAFLAIYGTEAKVKEAYENGDIGYYPGCKDMVELVCRLIDECGVYTMVSNQLCYFIDYEGFAKNYEMDHPIISCGDGLCVIYRE